MAQISGIGWKYVGTGGSYIVGAQVSVLVDFPWFSSPLSLRRTTHERTALKLVMLKYNNLLLRSHTAHTMEYNHGYKRYRIKR